MSILRILKYPDPKLTRLGYRVEDFGTETQKIIDDMFETHYAAENCAALAATQLDLSPAPAITVIDFSPEHNQPLCLVNPEIIVREGEQEEEEGCMSVPYSIYLPIKRALKIKVKAQDRTGRPFELEATGFMAKCIQHEIDHLHGKIFIDHLKPLKRKLVDERIIKFKKNLKRP